MRQSRISNNAAAKCQMCIRDSTTVEDMISNNVYGDKSSCYLVNAKGHVILSLESQSEFLSEHENLFTFLKDNAVFSENTYDAVEHDLQKVVKGRAKFNSQGISYYMVYQPVGLNDWSILGIVQTAAVNSPDEKIMHVTIVAITVLATCLLLLQMCIRDRYTHTFFLLRIGLLFI